MKCFFPSFALALSLGASPCQTIYSNLMDRQSLDVALDAFYERMAWVDYRIAEARKAHYEIPPGTSQVVDILVIHTMAQLKRQKAWEEAQTEADITGHSLNSTFFERGIPDILQAVEDSERVLKEKAQGSAHFMGPLETGEIPRTEDQIPPLQERVQQEMALFLRSDRELSVAIEMGDEAKVDRVTKGLVRLLPSLRKSLWELARAHIDSHRLSLP